MYHHDDHFQAPFEYHPERFLGDPRFDHDHKEALQPFHLGPRNCIGRKYVNTLIRLFTCNIGSKKYFSLAYAEMRLILARIIFNFDMRIAEESRGWINQKVWNLWAKGQLLVYLRPVPAQT
jgi:hypothetical protein